jgi:hypothetical protein
MGIAAVVTTFIGFVSLWRFFLFLSCHCEVLSSAVAEGTFV